MYIFQFTDQDIMGYLIFKSIWDYMNNYYTHCRIHVFQQGIHRAYNDITSINIGLYVYTQIVVSHNILSIRKGIVQCIKLAPLTIIVFHINFVEPIWISFL